MTTAPGQLPRRRHLILLGAVIGIAWAASLRGFMAQLAGPDSTFTFTGTFGIIIPTGAAIGALLGWAEYRRAGSQHHLLILAPLLLGIVPLAQPGALQAFLRNGDGGAPIGLAVLAMVGGYSVSGRGPVWARAVAGTIALADTAVVFLAPKPFPYLSSATAHGAWFATLASSLYVVLALACAIPMLRPVTTGSRTGQPPATRRPGQPPSAGRPGQQPARSAR